MIRIFLTALLFSCLLTSQAFAVSAEDAYESVLTAVPADKYKNFGVFNMIGLGAIVQNEKVAEMHFSSAVSGLDYVPVMVSVTSAADAKVLVHGRDINLLKDGAEIEPVSVHEVIAKLAGSWGVDDVIRNNVLSKVLTHSILYPGQTVTGYVFYKKSDVKDGKVALKLYAQDLNKVGYFNVFTESY